MFYDTEAEAWKHESEKPRYCKSSAKDASVAVIKKIKSELFDGVMLNLAERNGEKSRNRQERLLRRIVEKRQAQAAFRLVGHRIDLLAASMVLNCSARCMRSLNRHRHCA